MVIRDETKFHITVRVKHNRILSNQNPDNFNDRKKGIFKVNISLL